MNFEVIRATVENAQAMGYIHSCSWQKAYRNIIPENIINSFTAEHPRFLSRRLKRGRKNIIYFK